MSFNTIYMIGLIVLTLICSAWSIYHDEHPASHVGSYIFGAIAIGLAGWGVYYFYATGFLSNLAIALSIAFIFGCIALFFQLVGLAWSKGQEKLAFALGRLYARLRYGH